MHNRRNKTKQTRGGDSTAEKWRLVKVTSVTGRTSSDMDESEPANIADKADWEQQVTEQLTAGCQKKGLSKCPSEGYFLL